MMFEATLIFGWLVAVALVAAGWQSVRRRDLAWQRLAEAGEGAESAVPAIRTGRRLQRRWILVPWLLAAATVMALWLFVGLSAPYLAAIGLIVGLLAGQVEAFAARHLESRLEGQLADAIDIMIGAVGAGASVNGAIDAAMAESQRPLRPYLEELAGRIRLGDDPGEVFRSLAERVPLETFLLFTSALAVHWEVGGRLTTTLSAVGRTIRDRIEISRRIHSNTAQSQFSTIAIIGLTYFIAAIVWRNGPEQMAEFVTSTLGRWFVAGSMILQAVGIVWMNWISKPRF
jgi:tight adherence protein B